MKQKSTTHHSISELAGLSVKIKSNAFGIAGKDFIVEDWYDRVSGGVSWMAEDGNPACMEYAMRSGLSSFNIPSNNEVLYGKIGGMGYLVHLVEIEQEQLPCNNCQGGGCTVCGGNGFCY